MPQRRRSILGAAYLVGYMATIVAANWATSSYGMVPVGLGLVAPAGVYFAGLTFTLRDLTHETFGRRLVLLAILLGALMSAVIAPALGVASGVAFLVSELADFAVYSPLRDRNWYGAVLASNIVGLIIDSALFLYLAFGSLDYLAGQVVGKAWITLAAVAVLAVVRRRNAAPAAVSLTGQSQRTS
jgi:queuosine precursor transporter